MTNYSRAQVDCIEAKYAYPSLVEAMWRATAQSRKYVDVLISPDVPREVVPYIVRRIVASEQDFEYGEMLRRLDVKPQNLNRFLASAIQEMMDSLHDNVQMDKIAIEYKDNKLFFHWIVRNLDNDVAVNILFNETPGREITMESFLKNNKALIGRELDLTKRDIRKIFVIIKKIVKMFPRVTSKNTPLRGLYQSPGSLS